MPMKISWTSRAALSLQVCCIGGSVLRADTLTLKNDGIVSGAVLKSTADSVVIRTNDGILLQLEKTQISKQRVDSESEKAYVASLKNRPDDARFRWGLHNHKGSLGYGHQTLRRRAGRKETGHGPLWSGAARGCR